MTDTPRLTPTERLRTQLAAAEDNARALYLSNADLQAEVERLQAELEAQKAIAEQTYHLMGVEIDRLRAVTPTPTEGP